MRKSYVDILKGIGIFYVVFGHVTHISELRDYIWNFHMPLFFLISGFLYNPQKYSNFGSLFESRFKSIYIPYVLFFIVTFLYWLVVERNFRGGEYSILHQFIGLFYGTYEGNHLNFNGALWFLPCLFVVELIFYFVSKIKNKLGFFASLILSFVIGTLIYQNELNILPLGLHTAFFGIIFYGIGFASKSMESYFMNLLLPVKVLILFACLFIQILAVQHDYSSSIDATPLYYIPIGLVGILFYYIVSVLIHKNWIFEYLGKNSLIILAFQEQTYRAVIYLFSQSFDIDISILRTNLLHSIIISIVSLLTIVPIIYVYNTYVKSITSGRYTHVLFAPLRQFFVSLREKSA